ncbi:MAG: CpaF family protein [Candidatus Riflebacteria bacterium]|nr:CpaF family protein [Candidatus Riflebacteria bacterium]
MLIRDADLGQGSSPSNRERLRGFLRQRVAALRESSEFSRYPGAPSEVAKAQQHPELFIERVLSETVGYGAIDHLIKDPSVREIMVNGPDLIFVERGREVVQEGVRFKDADQLMTIIQRMLDPLGKRVDFVSPMVDARLPDGSRINVIIPPLSLRGPALTIRKFPDKPITAPDLIAWGSATVQVMEILEACVRGRLNIIVSGGTGSGKTTLLNVLSQFIPKRDRVVVIEDTAELQIGLPNCLQLEARSANIEGAGRITIRDLVRNALRMRPDRIVIGECRGGEALDMLQAMNTGHDGSMTTAHANTPRDLISRLEIMVLMAGMQLPLQAIHRQIAGAVNLILQQERLEDGSRRITRITEVIPSATEIVELVDLFVFRQQGLDSSGRVQGELLPAGKQPQFLARLAAQGLHLPDGTFP